jgi:acetoacetyl-[acyl-carrier protein] synthase
MWVGLATMTGRAVFTDGALRRPGGGSVSAAELVAELRDSLLKDTCIRRIESSHFDVDAVPFNARMSMAPAEGALRFITSALPTLASATTRRSTSS